MDEAHTMAVRLRLGLPQQPEYLTDVGAESLSLQTRGTPSHTLPETQKLSMVTMRSPKRSRKRWRELAVARG